jgi:hypothetical protein
MSKYKVRGISDYLTNQGRIQELKLGRHETISGGRGSGGRPEAPSGSRAKPPKLLDFRDFIGTKTCITRVHFYNISVIF